MNGHALVALVLLGAAAGCGPIEYIANVPLEAAGVVGEAKHVKGEKYAPYEMTAAGEYLHKSRELAGFARFHSSIEFAKKATKLGREARQIALDKAALPEDKNEEAAPPKPQEAKDVSTVTSDAPAK
jgi:hypothetical protein